MSAIEKVAAEAEQDVRECLLDGLSVVEFMRGRLEKGNPSPGERERYRAVMERIERRNRAIAYGLSHLPEDPEARVKALMGLLEASDVLLPG